MDVDVAPGGELTEDKVLGGLNAEQVEAVRTLEGPVLVTAGAGAGKTAALIRRTMNLIRTGVPPANIVVMTFTNKAADEIKSRLADSVGDEVADAVVAGTFHSVVLNEMLMPSIDSEYLRSIGVDPAQLSVMDDSDSLKAMRGVFDDLDEAAAAAMEDAEITPSKALEVMSVERAAGGSSMGLRELGGSDERLIADVWDRYSDVCRMFNGVDFDDILCIAADMLEAEPERARRFAERHKHWLLDEYQDTNPAQMRIVDAIVKSHENVFAVGDEKQSIYKFRGSDVQVMLSFRERFPNARLISMNSNYRSQPAIIKAANVCAHAMHERLTDGQLQAMRNIEGASPAVVRTPSGRKEADAVIQAVRRDLRGGVEGKDVAVLYRSRALRNEVEHAFVEHGIPYELVGDTSFHRRVEVRDAMGLLGFLLRPWDAPSTFRLLNATSLGVSESACRQAMSKKRVSPEKFLREKAATRTVGGKKTKVAETMTPLLEYREACEEMLELGAQPSEIAGAAAKAWDLLLRPRLARKAKDSVERFKEQVRNVEVLFGQFEGKMLAGRLPDQALAEMQLLSAADNDATEDKVRLMTIHAAKGMEFDSVYMIGCEDDSPEDDMEEERRIHYVGMTRARKRLSMFHAGERMLFGKVRPRSPSPFIKELVSSGAVRQVEWGFPKGSLRASPS